MLRGLDARYRVAMNNPPRITCVALSCLVQCATAALVSSTADAQATSPVVKEVSGEQDSWQQITVDIPEGTASLEIALSGGDGGDADLYVRFGADPTLDDWECRPFKEGVEESCAFAPPKAGTYHIGINAYTAYKNVKVTSTWKAADKNEPPTKMEDWKQGVVERHNALRADHCAAALTWDDAIAAAAQAYADKCIWDHDADNALGENLAASTSTEALNVLAPSRVDSWYAEIANYDFNNPGFGQNTGHFTQVVWRKSTTLGCGVAKCPPGNFGFNTSNPNDQATFLVCRYAPGGNTTGEYPANVLPKQAASTCPQP